MQMRNSNVGLGAFPQIPQLKAGNIPAAIKIYDLIYELICQGKFSPGDILPGENLLAKHWKISRATVRHAFYLLEEDGFLLKSQGKETSIAKGATKVDHTVPWLYNFCIDNCLVDIEQTLTDYSISATGDFLSKQLGCERGEEVARIELAFLYQNNIISTMEVFCLVKTLKDFGVDFDVPESISAFVLTKLFSYASWSETAVSSLSVENIKKRRFLLSNSKNVIFIEENLWSKEKKPLAQLKYSLCGNYYRIPMIRKSRN